MNLPDVIKQTGISVGHNWEPGDLGFLIYLHGRENSQDYGFNALHEAYCAKIATEFILNPAKDRSCAWIARKGAEVVGSVLIVERPENEAQLRLLFVAKSVRGIGLGRWLVEESVRYCASGGFKKIYLWTVAGLDRAISIYRSVGFVWLEEKRTEEWGRISTEIRLDLNLERR
jgi:GNAT superfamily N-acetyltransferase